MTDYEVRTMVEFCPGYDGRESEGSEFEKKEIVKQIKEVIKSSEQLINHITSDLDFEYKGCKLQVKYTFSCHDTSKEEAESFSAYSARKIGEELDQIGYCISCIRCEADEVKDYDVRTTLLLHTGCIEGESNCLMFEGRDTIVAEEIKKVIESSQALAGKITSNLNFKFPKFPGNKVLLEYTFSCCTGYKHRAESLSESYVKEIEDELENIGYCIKNIKCIAIQHQES